MSGQRFPRAARLLGKAQFDAAFAGGLRQHGTWFRAHALAAVAPHARLGLAIPKRAVPLASDRNRLRRHAREAFRRIAATLPPFDLVLVAKPGAAAAPNAALRRELDTLIARCVDRLAAATPR